MFYNGKAILEYLGLLGHLKGIYPVSQVGRQLSIQLH